MVTIFHLAVKSNHKRGDVLINTHFGCHIQNSLLSTWNSNCTQHPSQEVTYMWTTACSAFSTLQVLICQWSSRTIGFTGFSDAFSPVLVTIFQQAIIYIKTNNHSETDISGTDISGPANFYNASRHLLPHSQDCAHEQWDCKWVRDSSFSAPHSGGQRLSEHLHLSACLQ